MYRQRTPVKVETKSKVTEVTLTMDLEEARLLRNLARYHSWNHVYKGMADSLIDALAVIVGDKL